MRNRIMKLIFIFLISIVLLGVLITRIIVPVSCYPKVSITGQKTYTASELVDMLRPMNVRSWFNFDISQAVSILSSVSGIDNVRIRKVFPNKIYINIAERLPVAVTFINNGDKSVAVHIDRNGVIFPEKENDNYDYSSVPIVSGLPVEHLTEGMRIPSKYRTLIEQIASILDVQEKYFQAISEICVVPKEYGNYELVLIPSSSRIRVLTDRTLNEDALKYMMVVLDVVNSIEPDVSEIDLRYGSVSYRRR